jgi:uncharacterized protein (UPF0147 family)
MEDQNIEVMLNDIILERGIPRNIKTLIEESIGLLGSEGEMSEKIAHITSILDDASGDPNISAHTRTKIWNVVSFLEEIGQR